MNRLTGSIMIGFFLLASCKDKEQQSLNQSAENFADIECRAIVLREQRFDLANQIRFGEDTLRAAKGTPDTQRLNTRIVALYAKKQKVVNESNAVANSIKLIMDSLQTTTLSDTSSKRIFNEMLNAAIKRRGCMK